MALVRRFGSKRISESHKHYPAWYRRQMVVAGMVTSEWDAKHA